MTDFAKARLQMVDSQIRPNDVSNYAVLEAFGSVHREDFVAQSARSLAYIDEDILVHDGNHPRYLMEPMSMARLVQMAGLTEDDIVLDIGCATGYSSAILSRLCNSVVAIECEEDLVQRASVTLTEGGYDNVAVIASKLEAGCAAEGPYDVIFIGGSVDVLPKAIGEQLKPGGRLVVVEGRGNSGQARLYVKHDDTLFGRTEFNCAVKPLPGFEAEEAFVF